jgi:phosphatidylglycerophosphate synthase
VAAMAIAIAVRSRQPMTIVAGCALAFAALTREYTTLVGAHILRAAGWGARTHRAGAIGIAIALIVYLVLDAPESSLIAIAGASVLWAMYDAIAGGVALARREARESRPVRARARLHGSARWNRLGEGSAAARDPAFWGLVIARPLARVALQGLAEQTWLTPNRITAASVVCCLSAAGLIGADLGTAATVLAIVLIGLRSVLDSMDGQLARYRACGSQLGSYVDKVSDLFCWGALFGALGVRAYAAEPAVSMLLLPLFAGTWLALSGMALWLARAMAAASPAAAASAVGPATAWGRNLWRIVLFEEPDFYLWISLAVVTRRYDLFIPLIAGGHVARGLVLVIARASSVLTASSFRGEANPT